MTILYGDLETYCEIALRRGSHRYAEDCEIMVWSYALDDGPVVVHDFTEDPDPPADLREALADDDVTVVFQQSMFDRSVLRAKAPDLCPPLYRWRDTMAMALAHGLPGGLEKLGVILGIDMDLRKMAEGKALIQLFCKPRPKNSKIRRATRDTHPRQWQEFLEYAEHDITSMRAIYKKLPKWNLRGFELDLWHLDQVINDRGIPVDIEMVDAAQRIIDSEKARLSKHTQDLTEGVVKSTTQRDTLLEYILLEHGVDLPDLKSNTLTRRLEDDQLPWQVRALINNRLEASAASLAKFKAIKAAACRDERVRGTLLFNGAQRTGRWAGRIIQPQNFKRTPKYLSKHATQPTRDAIIDGTMHLAYEKPMEVLSSSVPWVIKAKPGKKIVASDLSNIEGRVLAWLAGEQWKLDAFRHYDMDPDDLSRDLYIIGYAKSFNIPIAEVIEDYLANGNMRQIGKVRELALGFGGSVGAFISMAAVYHIDLNTLTPLLNTIPKIHYDNAARAWREAEKEDFTLGLERKVYMICHALTMMWREDNPATVQFWKDMRAAAMNAVREPDVVFNVGKVSFERKRNWLRMRLPSGHYLCYANPKVDRAGRWRKAFLEAEGSYEDKRPRTLMYKGVSPYSRSWTWLTSYGGKLAENATQATATGSGGLLGWALPRVEAAGYEVIFHTHDEVAAEVPDTDDFSADELGSILTEGEEWSTGLPLAAGGYEAYFYRKD